MIEIKIPDIGEYKDVPVIEMMVKPGDIVKAEDPLLTLESDKAAMEVPAPVGGTVKEVLLKVGDKVSEGTLVLRLEAGVAATNRPSPRPSPPAPPPPAGEGSATPSPLTRGEGRGEGLGLPEPTTPPPAVHIPSPAEIVSELEGILPHASPSIRRFARELGVDVTKVSGSGPKGRILQEDIHAYVKSVLTSASKAAPSQTTSTGGTTLDLPPWPKVDFAKFGPIESRPLGRIKKLSGGYLARNWVMIPHVTQFDEADIDDLEAFRVALNGEQGVKLTMLAFLIKACVAALKKFPDFNASLDGQGDDMRLILKRYFHIGFAADTPNGLVVPVIRDADQKGLLDIARDMVELSKKARDGKLTAAEMQGGCFSISSLGGIGGTAFTPIINAPEVAILGVSKSEIKPKWDGQSQQFVPRLMLPLSLSYDHRVIDGASAARFTGYLAGVLGDMRRTLL
jgi:pyruvate dehydrogenase E2 component (dihydrolipoamide acetyltransferase)